MTTTARAEHLRAVATAVSRYEQLIHTNRSKFFKPYPWQKAIASGLNSLKRELLALCGNRTGKTLSASNIVGAHVTGDYPDWWPEDAPRLDAERNLTCWVLGVSNEQLRDVVQKALLGEMSDDGTLDGAGTIHKSRIGNIVRSGSTKNLISSCVIKRKNGGITKLFFKAYTQGGTGQGTLTLAGSSVDLIWVDEQPPDDVIAQLRTRLSTGLNGAGGWLLCSLTAELGETELVRQFLRDRKKHQTLVTASWDDVPHLTDDVIEGLLATLPPWQREMRRTGMPLMGTGLIYPVPRERLEIEPFEIPGSWRQLGALDIGIAHPTAWSRLAYDEETDTIYLVATYRQSDEPVAVHAAAIRTMNKGWIPTIGPPDIESREKGSGLTVSKNYVDNGVDIPYTFSNPDGTKHIAPGIIDLYNRMRTGRFRVFRTCIEWWDEQFRYHKDERGNIVKKDDDTMDSVRYGSQMVQRYGKAEDELQGYNYERYGVTNGSLSPGLEV